VKNFRIGSLALVLTVISGTAAGQAVGIGTTKGGATAQVAAVISKVVSSHAGGLQMRTQVMGGTQKYIPVVNAGDLQFGIANMMQTWMAYTGTGLSEGKKYDNLRLVATMMTFRVGAIVAGNSEIRKISDLKGKRIPFGFQAAPLFQHLMTAYLANGGLGWDDVQKVPQIGLRQHWDALKQGKIDVVSAAVGAAAIKDMNAKIKGGVRYVSFDASPAGRARILKHAPKTYLTLVNPAKPFTGVLEPVYTIAFDYMLWAHKGVPADEVAKVAQAMYENEKELKASSPLWSSHSSQKMAKDQGMPYHPGAEAYYKKVGIWKR